MIFFILLSLLSYTLHGYVFTTPGYVRRSRSMLRESNTSKFYFDYDPVQINEVSQNLNDIFHKWEPLPCYTKTAFEAGFNDWDPKGYDGAHGKSTIIDRPSQTMSIPLIDFSVESAVKKIIEALKESPFSFRTKALIGAVRGHGGGKTRSLEEIRRHMLKNYQHVLTIAVSFNHYWKFDKIKEQRYFNLDRFREVIKGRYSLMYSIASRMMSVFYGIPLEDIYHLVQQLVAQTEPIILFRATLQHMILKLDRPINGLVLLIDEARAFADEYSDDDNVFSIVHNEILHSGSISIISDVDIDKALVISSLENNVFGFRRGMKLSLPLPSRLSAERVVGDYWFANHRSLIESDYKWKQWELLANMLSTLPRLVEIAGGVIQTTIQKSANSSETFKLNAVTRNIISDIEANIIDRYTKNMIFPDPDSFFRIIHTQALTLSPENAGLVSSSVLTNVINVFPDSPIEKSFKIYPQASLMYLKAASNLENANTKANEIAIRYMNRLFRKIIEIIESVDDKHVSTIVGSSLEQIFYYWTAIRIASAAACRSGRVPLRKLGVGRVEGTMYSPLECYIRNDIMLDSVGEQNDMKGKYDDSDGERMLTLPSLRESVPAFRDKLIDISLVSSNRIVIAQSGEGDCFDVMVVVTLEQDSRPFVIFYDFKTASVLGEPNSNFRWSLKLKEYRQAVDLNNYMTNLTDITAVNQSPIIDAIRDKRYTHVYVTTYDRYITKDSVDTNLPNSVIMDAEKSRWYFGIAYPVYETVRAMVDAVAISSRRTPLMQRKNKNPRQSRR